MGTAFNVGAGCGALLMGSVLARTSFETMLLVGGFIPLTATDLYVWQWLG